MWCLEAVRHLQSICRSKPKTTTVEAFYCEPGSCCLTHGTCSAAFDGSVHAHKQQREGQPAEGCSGIAHRDWHRDWHREANHHGCSCSETSSIDEGGFGCPVGVTCTCKFLLQTQWYSVAATGQELLVYLQRPMNADANGTTEYGCAATQNVSARCGTVTSTRRSTCYSSCWPGPEERPNQSPFEGMATWILRDRPFVLPLSTLLDPR